MVFWMLGMLIVCCWVCSRLCRVFWVNLVVIVWLVKLVWVVRVLSVFLRLCMLECIFLVIRNVILLGILVLCLCVLVSMIVVWVLKFGGLIVIDRFQVSCDFRCVFRFLILCGQWLQVRMICCLLLNNVLKVWKNFFCVWFLLVKNWMLLISSVFICWNWCLN